VGYPDLCDAVLILVISGKVACDCIIHLKTAKAIDLEMPRPRCKPLRRSSEDPAGQAVTVAGLYAPFQKKGSPYRPTTSRRRE
jgi:hypothetical protein